MKNTIKIFLRTLKRKKVFSIITIGGYAISMSVIFIIVSFVIHETSTDKSFKNIDEIYRIKRVSNNAMVPQTLLDDVKGSIPEVDKMCLYNVGSKNFKLDNKFLEMNLISTTDDFIDMFSFKFIYQDLDPTLAVKDNIILTKTFSEKLFGSENPVGKTLSMGNEYSDPLKIVGVVTDIPSNSSFSFDAIVSSETRIGRHYIGYNQEQHVMFKALIMLYPSSNPEKVDNHIKDKLARWQAFKNEELCIQPFKQVYFDTETTNDGLNHANKSMIELLSVIALLILFMTIFNYVNMTVSGGLERMKEIGIKRTSGASTKSIFRQILSESLFTTLLSMIIAIILAILTAPLFSSLINKNLDFNILISQPRVIISGVALFILTGLVAGLYPAFTLSKITPLQNLSKSKRSVKGNKGTVIAFQFVVTSTLIISLLIIHKQLEYIKNKDLGFDKDKVVKIFVSGGLLPNERNAFKNELLAYHGISNVSSSDGSPMQLTGSSSGSFDVNGTQKNIDTKMFNVDENFVPMFKLEILNGRNFTQTDKEESVCLINEHLFKELEWDDIAGKKMFGDKVIGVVKDFNYENLYTEVGNLIIRKASDYSGILNVKISGDIGGTMDFIKKAYKEFSPIVPISYQFYDDWIQSMYEKEQDQAKAINLFTVIASIISCLGLIGFIEDTTNKRIKEIGIRKVSGAKVSEILAMLNKDFVKWVLLAFVIATPIAYYTMHKWLESFAYRTTLNWWIFALADVLTLGIALLTVSFQSWKAATKNPVEALRYE